MSLRFSFLYYSIINQFLAVEAVGPQYQDANPDIFFIYWMSIPLVSSSVPRGPAAVFYIKISELICNYVVRFYVSSMSSPSPMCSVYKWQAIVIDIRRRPSRIFDDSVVEL